MDIYVPWGVPGLMYVRFILCSTCGYRLFSNIIDSRRNSEYITVIPVTNVVMVI